MNNIHLHFYLSQLTVTFNRRTGHCCPINFMSSLSKRENVPHWAFKLNIAPFTEDTCDLKGHMLQVKPHHSIVICFVAYE
jgi:hypothetical protein